MASELTLFVNGAKQVVSAAPETPLIFVLRNELKLSGPRLGCGIRRVKTFAYGYTRKDSLIVYG